MKLLVLHDRPELYLELIQTRFPSLAVSVCDRYHGLAGALEEVRPDCVLAYRFEATPFPRESLFSAGTVTWVHAGGAGVDHLVPWDPTRVTVTNSSGIADDIMAQFVMGAIFALNFRLPKFLRQQVDRIWCTHEVQSAARRTLVIVGFGRIGSAIARRARAFDMRIIGIRSRSLPAGGADEIYGSDRMHDALARGEYVVLCLPLTKATRGLIDTAAIAAMKPGAFLINVARGGILDESALANALVTGHLAGAVLDVFSTEPLPRDSPLWDLESVVVVPHASTVFVGWERAAAEVFCANMTRWLMGRPLANVIDPTRGY